MPSYGWGPLTVEVTGPLSAPSNNADIFDTGVRAAQVVSCSATISIVYHGALPATDWDIYFYWYDETNTLMGNTHYGAMTVSGTTSQTASVTGLSGAHRIRVMFTGALAGSDSIDATGNGSFNTDVALTVCEYGTRLKSGLPALVALTPTVILTIIGKFASSWKGIIASFFAGRLLDTADLCSTLPPPMPEIGPSDILALTTYVAFGAHQEIVDKIWTWLQAAAWPFFCECVPGTPEPIRPDDPTPPTTGAPPVYGPFPCSESDQCTMLTQLLEQQDMMFGYFSMIRSELQALQSTTAPWGYELGELHSDLSGQGEFSVSGILGLSVEFTTRPLYIGQKSDDPTTYYNLGEIGLGSADGWKSSVKTSHNPHLIMPIGPEITRVSYSLATGAIANIQELVRHA